MLQADGAVLRPLQLAVRRNYQFGMTRFLASVAEQFLLYLLSLSSLRDSGLQASPLNLVDGFHRVRVIVVPKRLDFSDLKPALL